MHVEVFNKQNDNELPAACQILKIVEILIRCTQTDIYLHPVVWSLNGPVPSVLVVPCLRFHRNLSSAFGRIVQPHHPLSKLHECAITIYENERIKKKLHDILDGNIHLITMFKMCRQIVCNYFFFKVILQSDIYTLTRLFNYDWDELFKPANPTH